MQTKCKTCKRPKDLSEFYVSKNKNGHESSCRSCRNLRKYEARRERRIEQGLTIKFPTIAARQLTAEGMKYCPGCKQVKDLDDFSTMNVRSGVASHCRECVNRMAHARNATPEGKQALHQKYQRNRGKTVSTILKRKFGITLAEYNEKLDKQGGKCIVCEKSPETNGKMLAVDHNHSTGKNRDLLCASCNICIGFIEKNKLDPEKLKWYLDKHNVNS